jgi:hypothetical protein
VLTILVFLLFTRPDGVQVAINSENVVAVTTNTMSCPTREQTYILTTATAIGGQCVTESYEQVMGKLK